jgi:hypothetical protein
MISQLIKFKCKLLAQSLVLIVHTLAHLANRIVLPVVEFAIIED